MRGPEFFIVIFCLFTWSLTGCMGEQGAKPEQPPISLEQQESAESTPSPDPSDGLLYSTDKLSAKLLPPKASLFLGGELVPVSENAQALLVGITQGPRPGALVEINGKGRVLEPGDLLGRYRVLGILKNEVELEYEKE